MIETRDRAKLGQTTYKATGYRWTDDQSDIREVAGGEYKTVQAGKLAARSWLRRGAEQFTIWRGTYQDVEDYEPGYGVILHADWEQDDRWIVNGWVDGSGRSIEWVEETW